MLLRQAACEPNPAGASALGGRGGAHLAFRLGRLDEALAAATRALGYDPPTSPQSRSTRACSGAPAAAGAGRGAGELGQASSDPADKAAAYRLQAEMVEWQLRSRREALMAIERAVAASPRAGNVKTPGAAAIDIAHERLYQLVGRGAEVAAARSASWATGGSRTTSGGRWTSPGGSRIRKRHGGRCAGRWTSRPGDGAVLDAAVTLATKLGRDRDGRWRSSSWRRRRSDPGIARGAAARRRHRARAGGDPPAGRADRDAGAAAAGGRDARDRGGAGAAGTAGDADRRLAARDPRAPAAGRGRDGADTRATLLWELGYAHLRRGDLAGADADFARSLEADATFFPRCARWRGCARRAATCARRRSCTRARRG